MSPGRARPGACWDRGELIALERVREAERSPAQSERLAALYQAHIEGFEAQVRALLPGGWSAWEVRNWRFGYVVELSLAMPYSGAEQSSYSGLVGADEMRCLSSLWVSVSQSQVEPLLDALERHRPPLAELVFCGSDGETAEFDEDACERLWAALPGLRELSFSDWTRFAHINHPGLTKISLVPGLGSAGYVSSRAVELVASSTLPALERLDHWGIFDPPVPDETLDILLRDPQVLTLLERLSLFACPWLFEFLLYDEGDPDA